MGLGTGICNKCKQPTYNILKIGQKKLCGDCVMQAIRNEQRDRCGQEEVGQ
jgi:hypothetical protein